MAKRIAINGFGRIGRNVLRAAARSGAGDLEFVAVNDLTDTKTLAHLLKYDSVHGRFPGTVEAGLDGIHVDGKTLKVLSEKDPAALPWKQLQVDFVLECTVRFTDRESAAKHLAAGARKVVISAPAKGDDLTVVYGVNHTAYDPDRHHVLSNASRTTNGLVPVVHVVREAFGLAHGFMTTIHAYTNDQVILDFPHKDLRRARAAAVNLIPTSTGAAKAIGLVLPDLQGKVDGIAVRAPIATGSLTDLVVSLGRETSVDEVKDAYRAASEGALVGILQYAEDPIVSTDINGSAYSCIFDSDLTMVQRSTAKVFGWYDNEWGYSCRLGDVIGKVPGS